MFFRTTSLRAIVCNIIVLTAAIVSFGYVAKFLLLAPDERTPERVVQEDFRTIDFSHVSLGVFSLAIISAVFFGIWYVACWLDGQTLQRCFRPQARGYREVEEEEKKA